VTPCSLVEDIWIVSLWRRLSLCCIPTTWRRRTASAQTSHGNLSSVPWKYLGCLRHRICHDGTSPGFRLGHIVLFRRRNGDPVPEQAALYPRKWRFSTNALWYSFNPLTFYKFATKVPFFWYGTWLWCWRIVLKWASAATEIQSSSTSGASPFYRTRKHTKYRNKWHSPLSISNLAKQHILPDVITRSPVEIRKHFRGK
jgi:hypothetical protein